MHSTTTRLYIQGTRHGRMTYCYYQGKPTVVPLHTCYRYCYLLHLTGLLTRSTYILTPVRKQTQVEYTIGGSNGERGLVKEARDGRAPFVPSPISIGNYWLL